MVVVPSIRCAALEARLPRSQKLSPPVRRQRRRDPHRPRHGLEVLPAQQTHHYLTLAPGREPTPTAAPGGHAGRHRFLNVLPHLDTPPASTLSQSSVQENPRAQDELREVSRLAPPRRLDGFGRQRGKIVVGGKRHRECLLSASGAMGSTVAPNFCTGGFPFREHTATEREGRRRWMQRLSLSAMNATRRSMAKSCGTRHSAG